VLSSVRILEAGLPTNMTVRKTVLFILIATAVSALAGCGDQATVETSDNDLVDITSEEQFNTGISEGVSMVFYHASWCSKCAAQRPAVEEVSEDGQYTDVFFAEVEFEDFDQLVKDRNIPGFPTIVIYKDCNEEKRFVGQGHSRAELTQALNDLF